MVHVWLLFWKLALPNPATRSSTSPSSQKIAADLPPSSSVQRRISRPHSAPMTRPAAVDLVKLILSTRGWATNDHPASRPAGTMVSTPGGIPASAAASASTKESSAVSGDGFSTTVQPAAKAGAILNIARACG